MKKYKTEEEGYYMNVVVKQPTVVNIDGSFESVASEEMLCSNDNYHDCDDYNTEFCRRRCEFGTKESVYDSEQGVVITKMDDIKLDN